MTKERNSNEDGVSWLDVYLFVKEGWRVLFAFAALGITIALAIAIFIPQQPKIFIASGTINPGNFPSWQVGAPKTSTGRLFVSKPFKHGIKLIQEMQQPAFYSSDTLKDCGLEDLSVAGQNLINRLTLQVTPNQKDVSIVLSAPSPNEAKACLEGVLRDLISNEKIIHGQFIEYWEKEIAKINNLLRTLEDDKKQRLTRIEERLSTTKSRLNAAEELITKYSLGQFTKVTNGLPEQNITALINDKRNQINQLEMRIDELEKNMVDIAFAYYRPIKELNEEVVQLRRVLSLPEFNKMAEFTSPLSVSEKRIFPKKQALIIGVLIASALLGVLVLLIKRFINKIRVGSTN